MAKAINHVDFLDEVSEELKLSKEIVSTIVTRLRITCDDLIKNGTSFYLGDNFIVRITEIGKSKTMIRVKPYGSIVKDISKDTHYTFTLVKNVLDTMLNLGIYYANQGHVVRVSGIFTFNKNSGQASITFSQAIKASKVNENLRLSVRNISASGLTA